MKLWPFGKTPAPPERRAPSLPKMKRRRYEAAKISRLTADWIRDNLTHDSILAMDLKTLRARARDQAMNDPYQSGYVRLTRKNVIGPKGVMLQVASRFADGKLDAAANNAVEDAWWRWGKRQSCTLTRRFSWRRVERLVCSAAVRDGEIFLLKIKGRQAGNDFGFALQLLEADMLDESMNVDLKDGTIRLGVEYTLEGAPRAYHFFLRHPGDRQGHYETRTVRIEASRVVHVFDPDRVTQSRGVPEGAAAFYEQKMLRGYREAELVASRAAAAKYQVLYAENPDDYVGEPENADDPFADFKTPTEPGMREILPEGWKLQEVDPTHPVEAFPAFVKTNLQAQARAMGIAYHTLANDLANVNFSSGRLGELDQRDTWREMQDIIVEACHEQIFPDWLTMALLAGQIKIGNTALGIEKFDKLNAPVWVPRGWQWVDPLKENQANEKDLELRLTTRRRIATERGDDFDDLLDEMSREKDELEEAGLATAPAKETSAKPNGSNKPLTSPADDEEKPDPETMGEDDEEQDAA